MSKSELEQKTVLQKCQSMVEEIKETNSDLAGAYGVDPEILRPAYEKIEKNFTSLVEMLKSSFENGLNDDASGIIGILGNRENITEKDFAKVLGRVLNHFLEMTDPKKSEEFVKLISSNQSICPQIVVAEMFVGVCNEDDISKEKATKLMALIEEAKISDEVAEKRFQVKVKQKLEEKSLRGTKRGLARIIKDKPNSSLAENNRLSVASLLSGRSEESKDSRSSRL